MLMDHSLFWQYFCVASFGCIYSTLFERVSIQVPVYKYIVLGFMVFCIGLLNARALAYGVSHVSHILLRSSSLVLNLLIGRFVYSRRYSRRQIIGVLSISLGIFWIGWRESTNKIDSCSSFPDSKEGSFGVFLVALAMVLSSLLGFAQESIYKAHGIHTIEGMTFTHLFASLFMTLFVSTTKDGYFFDFVLLGSTRGFLLLVASSISNLICIFGVYFLNSRLGNLGSMVMLTLRKFITVLLLALIGNTVTVHHWICAFLIFGGSLIFG